VIPSRETALRLAGATGFEAAQLEVVLRLRDLLEHVNGDGHLRPRLALKGGTPLNLCFGPPPRLSVDLDFNYIGGTDRETMQAERPEVLDRLERIGRRAGYRIQKSRPEHAGERLFLRYRSAFGHDATLVVDLNCLHRVPLDPVETRRFWDPAGASDLRVRVVATTELVAGKLVALLDRVLARDLYDIARIRQRLDLEAIDPKARSLFIAMSGMLPHPLWDYSLSRLARVTDSVVADQLYPLLRPDDRPSAASLRETVAGLLEPWLVLSDQEREYVEALQRGELRPRLLFPDDRAIVERLARHPVLLWKAQNARQYRTDGPSIRGS
jgi:predicted nucleotidyltransferase component of viral defense system